MAKPKRKRCQVCDSLVIIEKIDECPVCHEAMCEDCIDEYFGACDNCIHGLIQDEISNPKVEILAAARAARDALERILGGNIGNKACSCPDCSRKR